MNTEILSYHDHNIAFSYLKTIDYNQKIIKLIEGNVLPKIRKKDYFLDIGAESGKITFPLSKYFSKSMAFEPNPSFIESFKEKNIILLQKHFDPSLLSQSFNLILASHVLYYVDTSLWSKFIDNIQNLLTNDGFGVITITAPTPFITNMHDTFNNGHFTVSSPIISYLERKSKNKVHVFRSKEYDLKIDSFKTAMVVYNFLIFGNCFSPEQQSKMTRADWTSITPKIESFVETTRDHNGYYHYIWNDDIIIFSN